MTTSDRYNKERVFTKRVMEDLKKEIEMHQRKFRRTDCEDIQKVVDLEKAQEHLWDALTILKEGFNK
jgi:hypothetical protein